MMLGIQADDLINGVMCFRFYSEQRCYIVTARCVFDVR